VEQSWRDALKKRNQLAALIYALVLILFFILYLPYFFSQVIEQKPGHLLNDFVLNSLYPIDSSWVIFILIYACILQTIITNFRKPEIILLGLVTYCSVSLLRMLTMYLFTLEPPPGLIPLIDPFVSLIAYDPTFTKDLFFSGHVSTLTVLILVEPQRRLKFIKIVATIVVSILLLLQHVHYTIDVVFAPLITMVLFRLMVQAFSLGKRTSK
jgi:PAP2 superfamily C-terminal